MILNKSGILGNVDRLHNFTRLEFEVTHRCNKNCKLCSHRVSTSDYDYLTRTDYEYIVSCIEDKNRINSIYIIGGEPLMHPEIEWLIERMKKDFSGAMISLSTNGKLLPSVSKEFIENVFEFGITSYPGFNDEIIQEYLTSDKYGRKMYHSGWGGKFYDISKDPNLNEKEAKEIREICHKNTRLFGTKMYGCCLSEAVERMYKTDPVHIQFDKDWKTKWYEIQTWKACQRCFRAADYLETGNLLDRNLIRYDHW